MKKIFSLISGILFIIIAIIVILIWGINKIYYYQEKTYYSDENNFISDKAIVENIIYDEGNNNLHLWLSAISNEYQDSAFTIKGENVAIVMESEYFKQLQNGTEIEYISAPGYFGDGYCMPIVAISLDGNELLNFEQGYENLMKLY